MAITVAEAVDSRSYSDTRKGGNLERTFIVTGTDDPEEAVESEDIPQLDEVYGGFDNLRVTGRKVDILKVTGDGDEGACKVTVSYETPETSNPPPEGEDEFEFSTMAQTEQRIRALAQINYPVDIDVGDIIGVDGDEIKGVDIYVPKLVYRESHERTSLSAAYRAILADTTGKINSDDFKGFSQGEVLFLGATARRSGSNPWRIEYQFAIERNASNLSFTTTSGVQVVPEKFGWEYMWFSRAKVSSGDDTVLKNVIEGVHLAQVYDWALFKNLGIGT